MKVRTDFVTNSSSSSFILARKEKLTEEQKQVIIDYVERVMLGCLQLTPDSTEDDIKAFVEEWYLDEDEEKEIRTRLESGNSIFTGMVCFEEAEWNMADMYISLWEKLQELGGNDFETIDGELDY